MASAAALPARRHRDADQREVLIGSFKRMEQIGQGSFATVYKAKHTKRSTLVAIKSVMLARLNKKLKDNLSIEIKILKELHHPHIVALFDCRESTNHIHLIMEYCPMGDLAHFLKKRDHFARHADFVNTFRKYPNPRAGGLHEVMTRHFFQQLCNALAFLRSKSLIHRDVKPQNLLILPPKFYYDKQRSDVPYFPSNWTIQQPVGVQSLPLLKLADFGFARSLPTTTLAETLCGSPLYMAPEILRYEKYDAKADLWSVGTVTFEMLTGKPPFRAANHIELLRKIEATKDNIQFPEEPVVSPSMQEVVRALLKRQPVERIGFAEFFENEVVKGDIPDLHEEDIPRAPKPLREETPQAAAMDRRASEPPRQSKSPAFQEQTTMGGSSGVEMEQFHDALDYPSQAAALRRPHVHATATDPSGENIRAHRRLSTDAAIRQAKQDILPSRVPASQAKRDSGADARAAEKAAAAAAAREKREAQDRAAQDVAFERDYVLVEKRQVEVNAMADEMDANRYVRGTNAYREAQQNALLRRKSVGSPPAGSQVPARQMHIATSKRADHNRSGSFEQRIKGSSSSTSSAISKAVAMASGRLLSLGLSPPLQLPLGLGRATPSPPVYNAFPPYPNQGSPLMVTERAASIADEDTKVLRAVEEYAHRSDVVYGFAEVKYKQLIPLAPDDQGLGLREAGMSKGPQPPQEEDDGLSPYDIVSLSEEALVLYVKSLSLLAQSMDVAGSWWSHKNRADSTGGSDDTPSSASPKSIAHTSSSGNRINKVVQWVRDRFNEVLEKAEFVRLKLAEAQRKLPADHPSHPNNHPAASSPSAAALGRSADNVYVSPGVSAEKLMYTRALELGRSAALNELVGDDLPGCEISYVTAIRLLEAVLDGGSSGGGDEGAQVSAAARKAAAAAIVGKNRAGVDQAEALAAGESKEIDELVDEADREQIQNMVKSFRNRLVALQRKMKVVADRSAQQQQGPAGVARRSPILPNAQLASPTGGSGGSPRSR